MYRKSWFFCLHPSSTFFTAIEHHIAAYFSHASSQGTRPSHLRLQDTNQSLIFSRRKLTQPMNIFSCRDHRCWWNSYQRGQEFIFTTCSLDLVTTASCFKPRLGVKSQRTSFFLSDHHQFGIYSGIRFFLDYFIFNYGHRVLAKFT